MKKSMHKRVVLTKLQTVLLIDLIIVAIAATGYFYVQTNARRTSSNSTLPENLKPGQITLSNLTVSPSEAMVNQTVRVTVNATNIGSEPGYVSISLLIDDFPTQNARVDLAAGESVITEFTVVGEAAGTHTVKISGLTASFVIKESTSPSSTETPSSSSSPTGSSTSPLSLANIVLSALTTNRTQAGINEPVKVTVKAINNGGQTGDTTITLLINGTAKDSKTLKLSGGQTGTAEFTITEDTAGTYVLQAGGLSTTITISSTSPPGQSSDFTLSDINVTPTQVETGQSYSVTVKVKNNGEQASIYSAVLYINDQRQSAQDVRILGGETQTITFTRTENTAGTYTAKIGSLTTTFTVVVAQPKPAKILLSNIVVTPYEAWPGDLLTITAMAKNYGDLPGNMSADLSINGEAKGTQQVQLNGGGTTNLQFTTTAPDKIGANTAKIGDISGTFLIVPKGSHTLDVEFYPSAPVGATITINGNTVSAPYVAILPVGSYTITVPDQSTDGVYTFSSWEDYSSNPTRTINLQSRMTITAYYTGGTTGKSSCPSLYYWNGTGYVYVSEVSNHGWLGYINYKDTSQGEDVPFTFYRNNPWDYIPLNGTDLQTSNGFFNLTLIQRWDEIFYLDQAYLQVVDHSPDVNVYSTMVEQYLDPAMMGQIYTVGKNLLVPVSAYNEKGQNVLAQIYKIDDVFTPGINGLNSPSWNNITWNKLTVNLGDIDSSKPIKLVVRAIVDWGSPDDYSVWLGNFYDPSVPNGTQVTPPPVLEVKDANGNWVPVPENRQFPIPPDGVARTFVVDLTGLFSTNDYSIRISNFWNVTFDYIGVDQTAQQNVTIYRIYPTANLYQAFTSESVASGNFTRYGDVTALVGTADDEFVIGRQGDAVSLSFDAYSIPPPPANMERDFFLYESCWFKDANGNWGFGFGFTVDPLPFENMTGFPYPPTEFYPTDGAHLAYLKEWNTRIFLPLSV